MLQSYYIIVRKPFDSLTLRSPLSSREHSRSVATYFAYSLVQTCAFTTHEASCNVKTDL